VENLYHRMREAFLVGDEKFLMSEIPANIKDLIGDVEEASEGFLIKLTSFLIVELEGRL